MDEEDLQALYAWIDEIPLSRQKRNIARDFSDAVLVAEVVKHLCPRLVEMHNYQPANSVKQKLANWHTLQHKVLRKVDLTVPENVLQGVVAMKPGVVEVVLNNLRLKIQAYLAPPNLAHVHVDMLNPGDARSLPSSRGGGHGSGSGRSRIEREPTSRSLKSSGSGGRGAGGHMAHPPMAGSPRITRVTRKPRDSPKMAKKSGRTGVGGGGRTTPLARGMTSASLYDHNPTSGSSYERGTRGGTDDPYDVINDQEQELLDCRETISILQIKVEKLEQLLQLKDRKIDGMAQRLEAGPGQQQRAGQRGYR